MRKFAVALAVLASLTSSAFADESPLMVRLRGVYVQTANKSDAITALGVTKNDITAESKLIPEVDFSYFFIPNLSAELILTVPQKHDIRVKGLGSLGTVTELPPCLTAQWHFMPGAAVNPYLGVGANMTLITGQDLVAPVAGALYVNKTSFGYVGQLGADFKLSGNLYANVDVKYVSMKFDVKDKATNTKVTTVTLDPWLLGMGVGYRF
jgi:outer membrane protein